MRLFAIGDLHLHFGSELKARGQLTGEIWQNHDQVFLRNCLSLIRPEDTLLLAGDHSWGRNMEECEKDFQYIQNLPGKKILLRGNHDMFWDAKKTDALNRLFCGRLLFLQNNYYPFGQYALVGTKGFTFEGPFYLDAQRRVVDWDREAEKRAEKLVARETERLRASFEAARADGYSRFIMFLHYPPTNILEKESPFTRMAEEYGAEQVIYAHCHGRSRYFDSIMGTVNGVKYSLVSGDFRKWIPLEVLDEEAVCRI